MQKAVENTKTRQLIVRKFFILVLYAAEKKIFFRLNIKIGEKAKNTPDRKAAVFFNTEGRSLSLSNLSFK